MAEVHIPPSKGHLSASLTQSRSLRVIFGVLLASFFLSACQSKPSRSRRTPYPSPVPRTLPEVNLYGSSATPPTSLSRYEYPFDANGNYIEEWAVAGEARAGRSSYVSSSEPRRATVAPRRSSATSKRPARATSRSSARPSTKKSSGSRSRKRR